MAAFSPPEGTQMKIKNLVVLFAAVFCSRSGAPAQTWTPSPTNFAYYLGVAMSADGCKLAAVGSGQHAIVSTDSGNTWQTNQASRLRHLHRRFGRRIEIGDLES